MPGWIKLHRNLIEWEWYTDHNTSRLFIHCLLRANFEDNEWRGISIKRGSFYTSLGTISTETGLSLRQIRTSLDKLISTGEVTSSGMARGRMITVLEYDQYQEDDRLSVTQMTGKRQGSDRVATTNKNDKKEKNDNNKDLFDDFWNAGMCKKNKKKAESLFNNLLKKQESPEEFTSSLITDIKTRLKFDQRGFSEMHPTTYLNGERWTDEVQTHGQAEQSYQQRPSSVDRVRQASERRQAERAAAQSHGTVVGEISPNIRQQVCEPIRGGTERELGTVIDGHYTRAD